MVRPHYFRAKLVSENAKPNLDLESRMSASSSDPLSLDTSVMEAAEARMRRALGLDGSAPKARAQERTEPAARQTERFGQGHMGHAGHKRQFVQDGEVPVTIVGGRREAPGDMAALRGASSGQRANRLEAAEAAAAAEAANRQQVERSLAEAHATIHDLQTKLGHVEIARSEVLDRLRGEQETVVSLRTALRECEERLRSAESERDAAERSRRVPRGPIPRITRRVEVAEPIADDLFEGAPDVAVAAPTRKPVGRRPKAATAKPARKPKLVRWWLKKGAETD